MIFSKLEILSQSFAIQLEAELDTCWLKLVSYKSNVLMNAIKLAEGEVFRTHGFRKFAEIREMLVGHSLGKDKEAYLKYTEEKRLNE